MFHQLRSFVPWIAMWCLLAAAGGLLISRAQLLHLREVFETDMRIVHRLLSQRVVQHDAVLDTLALLQPGDHGAPAEQRLPALYPQILSVQRLDPGGLWDDDKLRAAQVQSRSAKRAVLADVDFARGRYRLVLAAEPASFAMLMDLRAVVPWTEWPMAPQASPVWVTLDHDGQSFVLQAGQAATGAWQFDFHKHLAAQSQPFDVVGVRWVGVAELPWLWMLAWAFAVAAFLAALYALQRQRDQRRRAEELLRLGQVGRLNAMGELAAGMAHELNQPLTAILANTQAASRLLDEDPPELGSAREAMAHAAQQARRAADVIGRLRRTVQGPDADPEAGRHKVVLQEAARNALYLLEPQARHCAVEPLVQDQGAPVTVLAEPVALEQIVHNLLMNALQALQRVPESQRQLRISIGTEGSQGVLTVTDTGSGFAPGEIERIFEPFFSTREGGLGLGLSLCESLAGGMGGGISASHHLPRGAQLRLALPLASA